MTQRIGYAAGAFDLFHVGHLNLLRHAKQNCDVLIAGVVSDEMLRAVKGMEPVIPTAERAEIVRHPDNNTIFEEILAGRADLMITDATETRWQQQQHPELCAVHPEAPFTFSEKAYLLPRGDVVLQEWVNTWLRIARNDGTYDRFARPRLG